MRPTLPTVALRVPGVSTVRAFEYACATPRRLPRFISAIARTLRSRANAEGRSLSSLSNLDMEDLRDLTRLSSAPGRCADRTCRPSCISMRTSPTTATCHRMDRRARKSRSSAIVSSSSNPPIWRAAFARTRYAEVGAGSSQPSMFCEMSPDKTLRPPACRVPVGCRHTSNHVYTRPTRGSDASMRSHLAQELGFDPLVVVVQKRDVLAARQSDARVPGSAHTHVVCVPYSANTRVRKGLHHLRSIVRGTVIHDDQLVALVSLGQDAGDRAGQQRRTVVRGHDHAHLGGFGCLRHDMSTTSRDRIARGCADRPTRNDLGGSGQVSERSVRGS